MQKNPVKIFTFVYLLLAALLAFLLPTAAFADASYPYTNPTYIPNAFAGTKTLSAPADILLTTNGLGVAGIQITGTCTGLTAAFQGSVDSANWTTMQVRALGTGTAATSITAAGFWRSSVAGLVATRLHVTALTAACTISIVGDPAYGPLE